MFDELIELDEILVPANEEFNYRLLFGVVTKIRNTPDGLIQETSSTADFSHTLEVVGLSVRDSAGNPIPFQVTSGSGALYTDAGIAAVPEPSTILLLTGKLIAGVLGRSSAKPHAARSTSDK